MSGVSSHGSDSADPVYNADGGIITGTLHHGRRRRGLRAGPQEEGGAGNEVIGGEPLTAANIPVSHEIRPLSSLDLLRDL